MPLPPIGLDMDGVIVSPPLGWNFSISRRLDVPPLTAEERAMAGAVHQGEGPRGLRKLITAARYAFRGPLPQVQQAIAELATKRELHIVSARSAANRGYVQRWLAAQGLASHIAAIHLNAAHLAPARFKLAALLSLGIQEHVDDDGATAYYLATQAGIQVYLCDWPRNRDLPYPASVRRVPGLHAVAPLLSAQGVE